MAAVRSQDVEHAFDQLREYHGKTNSWGSRGALISTVGMLLNRYENARCDNDGVSCCIHCQTMFLVSVMKRLLAASVKEQNNGK